MDTAEEAAVRRRRGGRGEGRRGREGGREGCDGRDEERRGATRCRGQSALTATGIAEWELSRFDRWTDRATPRWQTLALDGQHDAQTSTSTHTERHTDTYCI